jgi:hypothetical protein
LNIKTYLEIKDINGKNRINPSNLLNLIFWWKQLVKSKNNEMLKNKIKDYYALIISSFVKTRGVSAFLMQKVLN